MLNIHQTGNTVTTNQSSAKAQRSAGPGRSRAAGAASRRASLGMATFTLAALRIGPAAAGDELQQRHDEDEQEENEGVAGRLAEAQRPERAPHHVHDREHHPLERS